MYPVPELPYNTAWFLLGMKEKPPSPHCSYRFMVAARNLSPGDVILKERPAIVGPNVSTASQPLCVECGRPLDEASSSTKCPDCGVPLCSKECGNALTHKSECAIFRRCPEAFYSCIDEEASGVSPTATANYQLVIPVRMVLLRRRDVRRYKSVMALQSHLEERRGTEHERRAENQVVRLMQLYRVSCGGRLNGSRGHGCVLTVTRGSR